MTNLDSILKSRDITLSTNVHLVKLCFFQWLCMDVRVGPYRKLSSEEMMLLNCGAGKDSWESLGLQGDQTSPSSRKSILNTYRKDWCWPIFWPLDEKNWLIGKDSDAGKDWGQEEKGMTEDKMAGWHHWLNGCEFKQTHRDSEGQGSLVHCRELQRVGSNWATEQQSLV